MLNKDEPNIKPSLNKGFPSLSACEIFFSQIVKKMELDPSHQFRAVCVLQDFFKNVLKYKMSEISYFQVPIVSNEKLQYGKIPSYIDKIERLNAI